MFYVLITFVYKQAERNYLCFMFVIVKKIWCMGGFFEDCMELRERKERNEKFRVSVYKHYFLTVRTRRNVYGLERNKT